MDISRCPGADGLIRNDMPADTNFDRFHQPRLFSRIAISLKETWRHFQGVGAMSVQYRLRIGNPHAKPAC
jgi:hypothetical protein